MVKEFFPEENTIFQDDNAPIHKAKVVTGQNNGNTLKIDTNFSMMWPGGTKFKKGHFFMLKRHCQQKQILVVMLQFEILVDMIEFQFPQDKPVPWKSFILLICYFALINFSVNVNSF